MVDINTIKKSLAIYLETEMLEKINGWQAWVVGGMASIALEKWADIFSAIKTNPLLLTMEIVKDENLWITSFSQDMFDIVENKNILIDNECINKASKNEYCFIENIDVNAIIEKVDKIILYNWNRKLLALR